MKIFVTGAAGMLAADVIPELLKNGYDVIQTDVNLRHAGIRKLDVTDFDAVQREMEQNKPDYVFHLAAETDVDLCEQDTDHAFRVNAAGTKNIAMACREHDIPVLYISSGAVFSGDKKDPYTEFDEPNPLNVYGKSKLEGEVVVKELLSRYFVIRAGWMVGGWQLDKKFVYKIMQQLNSGRRELMAVNDKFGSPTFTKDFAANLMDLINSGRYGLYHMANKGTCTRYEMAVKIVEFAGLKSAVRIDPVTSDNFKLAAPRGRSEMLENHKLNLLGIDNMPHWNESLKEYVGNGQIS